MVPSYFHDAGSVVTVEGRYVAVHGETARSMDCQFCHVWTLNRDRITKFQQYVDTASCKT